MAAASPFGAARRPASCLVPLASFIQGMTITRGLIVAIGAQNAFVLRQALDALIGLCSCGRWPPRWRGMSGWPHGRPCRNEVTCRG